MSDPAAVTAFVIMSILAGGSFTLLLTVLHVLRLAEHGLLRFGRVSDTMNVDELRSPPLADTVREALVVDLLVQLRESNTLRCWRERDEDGDEVIVVRDCAGVEADERLAEAALDVLGALSVEGLERVLKS